MLNLIISIVAYALAAYFLARAFQTGGLIELLAAAVFTSVGKTYIKRFKEGRRN